MSSVYDPPRLCEQCRHQYHGRGYCSMTTEAPVGQIGGRVWSKCYCAGPPEPETGACPECNDLGGRPNLEGVLSGHCDECGRRA